MMANGLSEIDRERKNLFINKCWQYLDENFHKFTDANKLKVALAIVQKNMPTQIEGGFNLSSMPTVKIEEKELEVMVGDNPRSPDSSNT